MDTNQIIKELLSRAKLLPEKGWVLNCIGALINKNPLQKIVFQEQQSLSGGGYKEDMINKFTTICDSIMIIRILSAHIYMNYPKMYLPITKIAHVFIGYLVNSKDNQKVQYDVSLALANFIIQNYTNEATFTGPEAALSGGDPSNNNTNSENDSVKTSFEKLIFLIFSLFLLFAPSYEFKTPVAALGKVAMFKALGPDAREHHAMSVYHKAHNSTATSVDNTSVYSRPNVMAGNLVLRLFPEYDDMFRAPNYSNGTGGVSLIEHNPQNFSNPNYFLNVSITPEFRDNIQKFIMFSGFDPRVGESGFTLGVGRNRTLHILNDTINGDRMGAAPSRKSPSNKEIAHGHIHPFRWAADMPESIPDVDNALIINLLQRGSPNEIIFTQQGIVVITFDQETLRLFNSFHNKIDTTLAVNTLRGIMRSRLANTSNWYYEAPDDGNSSHYTRMRQITVNRPVNTTGRTDGRVINADVLKFFNSESSLKGANSFNITARVTTYGWNYEGNITIGMALNRKYKGISETFIPDTTLDFLYKGRASLTGLNQSAIIEYAEAFLNTTEARHLLHLQRTNNTAFLENRQRLMMLLYRISDIGGFQNRHSWKINNNNNTYGEYNLSELLDRSGSPHLSRNYNSRASLLEEDVIELQRIFIECVFGINTDRKYKNAQRSFRNDFGINTRSNGNRALNRFRRGQNTRKVNRH